MERPSPFSLLHQIWCQVGEYLALKLSMLDLAEDNGTVLISDAKGTGAIVSYTVNQYGEVENFIIDSFGQGYDSNATLSIVPDPSSPNPLRPVVAIPRLVNPLGDVFKIKTRLFLVFLVPIG